MALPPLPSPSQGVLNAQKEHVLVTEIWNFHEIIGSEVACRKHEEVLHPQVLWNFQG